MYTLNRTPNPAHLQAAGPQTSLAKPGHFGAPAWQYLGPSGCPSRPTQPIGSATALSANKATTRFTASAPKTVKHAIFCHFDPLWPENVWVSYPKRPLTWGSDTQNWPILLLF